jgi:hypothetical protein
MTIDLSDDEANVFYNIFCCKRTDFSFKYLGDPLHHTKLRKEDDHQKGGWHLSARCCYSYCSINKGNQQQQLARKSLLQQPQRCSCGTPFRQLLFNQQRKPAAAAPWLQE